MRATEGFWNQVITTERLCERYRLLSERRRLAGELVRIETRIASVAPALARLAQRRRLQLEPTLCAAPNLATVDRLWRDQRALTTLLARASRDWLDAGAP
ncbi:MAG: hypothetical protein EA416_08605 [Trueperaceae bacterium]|nr:MAG: hypothetical protein EA416_08605 [Trueperaceae bacterium]